jgi:hypothetical protein
LLFHGLTGIGLSLRRVLQENINRSKFYATFLGPEPSHQSIWDSLILRLTVQTPQHLHHLTLKLSPKPRDHHALRLYLYPC